MNQLLLSLAQVLVAVILSALSAFLAFSLFQWFTRDVDEAEALRRGNVAIGVVLGAFAASVAIVLRPALSLDTSAWDAGSRLFSQAVLAEILQIAVGLVFAVITVGLALLVFSWLTRGLDEIAELKKGNLAVAALLAGIAIGVGVMVSHAIAQLMGAVAALLF